jgi:hypothetical protein
MVDLQPSFTVKLRAKAQAPSHSLANISIRDLNFSIDEPEARGAH